MPHVITPCTHATCCIVVHSPTSHLVYIDQLVTSLIKLDLWFILTWYQSLVSDHILLPLPPSLIGVTLPSSGATSHVYLRFYHKQGNVEELHYLHEDWRQGTPKV